ncbi:MAG: GNAT family N-acetyltransferase [Bacteroidota bacterium]
MVKYAAADYYQQSTARLRFRKMEESDLSVWKEFFYNNPLEGYLGIDVSLDAETKAVNWINLQLKRYKGANFGHLAAIDKQTDTFIGVGGIIPRELDSQPEFEIAYSILPVFWGKGYATELAQQMKKYAKKIELWDSLISIIHIDNHASKKVARKNGMEISARITYLGMEVEVFRLKLS